MHWEIHSAYRKMQADLYNLKPVIGEVNGLRRNTKLEKSTMKLENLANVI